jgi:hypothetical protein
MHTGECFYLYPIIIYSIFYVLFLAFNRYASFVLHSAISRHGKKNLNIIDNNNTNNNNNNHDNNNASSIRSKYVRKRDIFSCVTCGRSVHFTWFNRHVSITLNGEQETEYVMDLLTLDWSSSIEYYEIHSYTKKNIGLDFVDSMCVCVCVTHDSSSYVYFLRLRFIVHHVCRSLQCQSTTNIVNQSQMTHWSIIMIDYNILAWFSYSMKCLSYLHWRVSRCIQFIKVYIILSDKITLINVKWMYWLCVGYSICSSRTMFVVNHCHDSMYSETIFHSSW